MHNLSTHCFNVSWESVIKLNLNSFRHKILKLIHKNNLTQKKITQKMEITNYTIFRLFAKLVVGLT